MPQKLMSFNKICTGAPHFATICSVAIRTYGNADKWCLRIGSWRSGQHRVTQSHSCYLWPSLLFLPNKVNGEARRQEVADDNRVMFSLKTVQDSFNDGNQEVPELLSLNDGIMWYQALQSRGLAIEIPVSIAITENYYSPKRCWLLQVFGYYKLVLHL